MSTLKRFFLLGLFAGMTIFSSTGLFAQDPPPPPPGGEHGQGGNNPPGGGAPIGGGVFVLSILAMGYGLKKWRGKPNNEGS